MKKSLILYRKVPPFCRKIAGRLALLLFLCSTGFPGYTAAQQSSRFTVNFSNSSLPDIFDYLGQNSDAIFVYNSVAVKNDPYRISKSFKDASLQEVLNACLAESRFEYEVVNNNVVIRLKRQQVKEYVVKGKVVNEKNEPMPGVTVCVDGTSIGVASDVDGNFTLRLPMEKGRLTFSFVGYKDKNVSYSATKPLTIQMEENIAALDEVQVVAYGSQKKRTMVSAISSVKADDIKELPTHSLENLLQGHMAGVEVNNMSGAPGGGGAIVSIRGYNSFFVDGESSDRGYGTPLYVVDGVPMQAFTSPITGTNTLSDLDPSMIESIEVLKDAASAAIYGSRAGNGVILITTKKGKAGQAKFSANVSYSASWLPKTPVQTGGQGERLWHLRALQNSVSPYLDADGHWKIPTSIDEVYNYKGDSNYGPIYDWFRGDANHAQNSYTLQDSLNPFYNNSTDWWRYAYHTAKVLNANLQASGGSERFRYMIGGGYYKEEGIQYGTDYQRVNVMTNLMVQPAPKLTLENQISLSYTDRSRGGGSADGAGGGQKIEGISVDPMFQSTLLPGNEYIESVLLERLNSRIEKNHGYSARYNLVLDYEIIRNMRLRISGGLDYNQQNQNNFSPSTLDKNTHFSKSTGTIGRELSILNENLLSYNFKIRKDHNFDVLLGLSFQKDQSYYNKGSGEGGPNDDIHYVGDGWGGSGGILHLSDQMQRSAFQYESSFEEERLNSYFGRLTYNYREKYLFETTVRRDGSSVFGEKVRWATFPSVAVGWAFSEEPFLKDLYWLSFGKIRVSWGKSGQKFHQRYLAQGLVSSGATWMGKAGMIPNGKGGMINRGLTWEETNQYDIGLDLNFLDYRIKLTCDYYYRYTEGQLQSIQLPGDVHYHSNQWQNALAVSNEGLELELTADIFRETAVKWRMKVNASRNWNRFEKSSDGFDFGDNIIGKPLYQISVYKTDGYYNSLAEVPLIYRPNGTASPMFAGTAQYGIFFGGTRKLVDLNGDGRIGYADKYMAVSPLPKAYGGIIHEVTWKNFDLNVLFSYSIGRHIIRTYDDILGPGENPIFVDLDKIHTWQQPGDDDAEYPYIQYYRNPAQYEGLYDSDIENVHMLRLKQLTLGYNLHEMVTKKIGINGVRIFLTAENLFLLTNYKGLDPEIVNITSGIDRMGGYPLPRKFTVGLTVNF